MPTGPRCARGPACNPSVPGFAQGLSQLFDTASIDSSLTLSP